MQQNFTLQLNHLSVYTRGDTQSYLVPLCSTPALLTSPTYLLSPTTNNPYPITCPTYTSLAPKGPNVFYPDDLPWDGNGCIASSTCCLFKNPPYFSKQLPSPTTDDNRLDSVRVSIMMLIKRVQVHRTACTVDSNPVMTNLMFCYLCQIREVLCMLLYNMLI